MRRATSGRPSAPSSGARSRPQLPGDRQTWRRAGTRAGPSPSSARRPRRSCRSTCPSSAATPAAPRSRDPAPPAASAVGAATAAAATAAMMARRRRMGGPPLPPTSSLLRFFTKSRSTADGHGTMSLVRVERPRRLALLVGAVVLLIAAGSAVAWGVTANRGGVDDLLPNLTQAVPNELSGRTGGTAAAPRFFLGFESAAGNLGVGPLLVLGQPGRLRSRKWRSRQRILRSDGSYRTVPRAREAAVRPLERPLALAPPRVHALRAAQRRTAPRVVRDRKTGFCLGDRYRADAALPGRTPNPQLLGPLRQGRARAEVDPGRDLDRLGRRLLRPPRGPGAGDHLARRRGATCSSIASTRAAICVRATTPTTSPRWRSSSAGRADSSSLPASTSSAGVPGPRPVPRSAPATHGRYECQYLRDEPQTRRVRWSRHR